MSCDRLLGCRCRGGRLCPCCQLLRCRPAQASGFGSRAQERQRAQALSDMAAHLGGASEILSAAGVCALSGSPAWPG